MLRGGEYISIAINLLVAAYLIYFYPNHARRQFQNRPMPPFFRLLASIAPVIGYILAVITLLYLILRMSNVIPS